MHDRALVDCPLLQVDQLDVHLALNASVSNIARLSAGVDASVKQVALTIDGVHAEAHLEVN